MGRNPTDKINWRKTGPEAYAAGPHKTGDYTATVVWNGTVYTLTITGPSAPAPSTYPTRKRAKHAYQQFLHTKP